MSRSQASLSVAGKSAKTVNRPFDKQDPIADEFIYRGRVIKALDIDLPNCKAKIASINGEIRLNTESTTMGRVKMLAMKQVDEDINLQE